MPASDDAELTRLRELAWEGRADGERQAAPAEFDRLAEARGKVVWARPGRSSRPWRSSAAASPIG